MASIGALFVAAAAHAACYSTTQIELSVSTDLPCDSVAATGGAEIFVARDSSGLADEQPRATAAGCVGGASATGGSLGTLVLVPSGERNDTVTVEVVLRLPERAAPCRPPNDIAACIVARRRVRFIEHQSLRMPITLDSRCRGVICGGDQTCDRGQCFDIDVGECAGGDCEVLGAPVDPPDAASFLDGPDLLDASNDAIGALDGPVIQPPEAGTDSGTCPPLVPFKCAACGTQRCCIVTGGTFACGVDCASLGNDRVCTHDCQCGVQKCQKAFACNSQYFCGGSCAALE